MNKQVEFEFTKDMLYNKVIEAMKKEPESPGNKVRRGMQKIGDWAKSRVGTQEQ